MSNVELDSNAVYEVMVTRLAQQNLDLVREVAKLEVYVRTLREQIEEIKQTGGTTN